MTDSLALKMAIDIIVDTVWFQPLVAGQQVGLVLGYKNAMDTCTRVACMCQIRFLAIIRFANSQDCFEPYSENSIKSTVLMQFRQY